MVLFAVCAVCLAACGGGGTETVTTVRNISLQAGERYDAEGTQTEKRFVEVETNVTSGWGFTLTQGGSICSLLFENGTLTLAEGESTTTLISYDAEGEESYAIAADGGTFLLFAGEKLIYPYQSGTYAQASLGIVNQSAEELTLALVRYSGAARYAEEKIALAGEATLTAEGEGISVSQFGRVLAAGEKIYPENAVTVQIPEEQDGSVLSAVTLKNGDRKIDLTKISEGVWTFLPRAGGAYVLTVQFDVLPSLTLVPQSAVLETGGKTYELYEEYYDAASDWQTVEVNLVRLADEQEQSVTFTGATARVEGLQPGSYRIAYTYGGLTHTAYAELSAGDEQELILPLSPAELGGDGIADPSYASGWEFYDGAKDSVLVQKSTYVFAGGKMGTFYYVEGTFDATQTAMQRSDVYGLLIAHESSNIDHFLIAGIYGSSVYVSRPMSWGTVGEDNIWPIANIDDLAGADTFDRSAVRLGVVRDGDAYYFFVNGIYAGRYVCTPIAGVGGGISNIGVAAAGNGDGATVRNFNYSFNEELLTALKAQAPARGEIDVYFIAGQSNASGYSAYSYDQALQEDSHYAYGFTNIWYAGNSRSTAGAFASQRELEWQLARIGLGRSTDSRNYFGPELGMADALSSYYNAESGKTAAIIKYAAGGTSLLNNLGGENAPEGNWVSPSYQASLDPSGVSSLTGGLYRNFIAEAQKRVGELKSMGYTVNVRGLFWMQGESDVGQEVEYKKAFAYFVSDIRGDLGEIAGADLSSMPVYVGQISQTTGGDTSGRPQTFIDMQNTLVSIKDVYVIESGQYKIGPTLDAGCYDVWHWSYRAQLAIGNLVGEKMLEVMGI